MAKKKAAKKEAAKSRTVGSSPRINFRITKEMAAKLEAKAGKDGNLSAIARDILAEALGMTEDAKRIKQGRPTISDNS
jgi:hypothetical protein